MAAADLMTALRVPYGQLSDMLESMLSGRASTSYPTLYRRMQLLDVDVRGNEVTVRDPDSRLVMVADATGLKQHRRGEWIRHKRGMRRGFVKLHLPMDADTRGVLAAAVTDEKAGDGAQLPALLHMAVGDRRLSGAGGPDRGRLAEGIQPVWAVAAEPAGAVLYADGGYASRANVVQCARPSVAPNIRLPVNRTARGRGGGDAWGLLLRRRQGGGPQEAVGGLPGDGRLENLRYWKGTVGYGTRWLVEIVISAIKRMFGEDLMARKWPNMARDVVMRLAPYDRWTEGAAAVQG